MYLILAKDYKTEEFISCVEWNVIPDYASAKLNAEKVRIIRKDTNSKYSFKVELVDYFKVRNPKKKVTDFITVQNKKDIDYNCEYTQDCLINLHQEGVKIDIDSKELFGLVKHLKSEGVKFMLDTYGFELILEL